jgi:hypothetical protein
MIGTDDLGAFKLLNVLTIASIMVSALLIQRASHCTEERYMTNSSPFTCWSAIAPLQYTVASDLDLLDYAMIDTKRAIYTLHLQDTNFNFWKSFSGYHPQVR